MSKNKNIVCEPEVAYQKNAISEYKANEYEQTAIVKESRMTIDKYISKVRAALDKKLQTLRNTMETDIKTKNKRMKTTILWVLCALSSAIFLTGCFSMSPNTVSTIVGGEYDVKKNVTEYFVYPYGSVALPGKWEKTTYNRTSRQQFFINQDSISVAVAFGRYDNYEFNVGGSIKGFDFLKAYYDWETKYFKGTYGFQSSVIEENKEDNYMLFRVFGNYEGSKYDTYYLLRENSGNVSHITINATSKWTEREKVDFLKMSIKQK